MRNIAHCLCVRAVALDEKRFQQTEDVVALILIGGRLCQLLDPLFRVIRQRVHVEDGEGLIQFAHGVNFPFLSSFLKNASSGG